jgi:hypothetical protein
LRHSCSHFPWRRHFTFHRNTEFAMLKKGANELDQTGRKFQFR